jgi:hypothetical protein
MAIGTRKAPLELEHGKGHWNTNARSTESNPVSCLYPPNFAGPRSGDKIVKEPPHVQMPER